MKIMEILYSTNIIVFNENGDRRTSINTKTFQNQQIDYLKLKDVDINNMTRF
jgi:uncharacterized protein YxeA